MEQAKQVVNLDGLLVRRDSILWARPYSTNTDKWRVEFLVVGNESPSIGYFDTYEEAIAAAIEKMEGPVVLDTRTGERVR